MPNGDVWESYIQEAQERVLAQGFDNARDRDVQVAMFGYLSHSLKESLCGRTPASKLEVAKRVGVPAVAGGGILTAIIEIMRALAQR